MHVPSEQFIPVLPSMHVHEPSNRLHVALLLHVQFSRQFFPKFVDGHSEKIILNKINIHTCTCIIN